MRDKYHDQLDELKTQVIGMADLARGMLQDGTRALVALDRALAGDVLARKDRLAEMDDAIEDFALHLVAKQQPMAKDLRAIGAALKLITYVNRLGRYGKDFAQVASEWKGGGHVARIVQIPAMAETVVEMMDLVMGSYRDERPVDVERLLRWEDDVDATRWSVFRECLTYMAEDPKNIEPCAHYMMVARYLERCGDNICKMAEKTHYMVTGERVTVK